MSIIRDYNEGKTQLNKLKYKSTMGAGHPGNPPLVTRDIPTEPASRKSPDLKNGVERRADDVTRLTKLFGRPEGLGLLANNTNLNSAVAMSYTVQGSLSDKVSALADSNIGGAVLDTLGTLSSTLLQAGVNGTGTHFVKGKPFGKKRAPFNNVDKKTIGGFGDPGSVKVKYDHNAPGKVRVLSGEKLGQDKVNMMDVYGAKQQKEDQDLIKFLFEVIRPGQESSSFLHFRAYIDTISDFYNGNWNEYQYIGRGEKFFSYSGFTRELSVSFKSAVASKAELLPVYRKLNFLASTTAPTYSENNLMRGSIVRMTIGDLILDQPGFVSAVSFNWNTNFPFEVNKGEQLPHVLEVQLNFTPIHTFVPRTGLKPYIGGPKFGSFQSSVEVGQGEFGSPIPQPSVEIGEGTFGEFGTDGDFNF